MSSVPCNSSDSEISIEDTVFQLSNQDLRCARIDDSSTPDENGKLLIVIPSTGASSVFQDFGERNKSSFQRTIMPSIVTRLSSEMFDWNSQEQWSQSENLLLFSTRSPGTLSFSPKPDLSMSFTLNSLTGKDVDDPVPFDLEICLSPENSHCCFPFLFWETNHEDADPMLAFRMNLGTAALALKCIYEFMVRAGQEERFFEVVRVYSFILNPGNLNLRQHRAKKRQDGQLTFHFQQLQDFGPYTQSQANLLSEKIVTEYAANILHPLLVTTFKTVGEQTARQNAYLRSVSRRETSSCEFPKPGQENLKPELAKHL
jgi:hypothetical protein